MCIRDRSCPECPDRRLEGCLRSREQTARPRVLRPGRTVSGVPRTRKEWACRCSPGRRGWSRRRCGDCGAPPMAGWRPRCFPPVVLRPTERRRLRRFLQRRWCPGGIRRRPRQLRWRSPRRSHRLHHKLQQPGTRQSRRRVDEREKKGVSWVEQPRSIPGHSHTAVFDVGLLWQGSGPVLSRVCEPKRTC